MAKRKSASDVQATAWFSAAARGDTAALGALLADGFDINTRDARGRTALFHAIAPYGGIPATVSWLVEHGANVRARDHDGVDALAWGSAGVSSGLEASMLSRMRDLFERYGYPPRERPLAPKPTPPKPAPSKQAPAPPVQTSSSAPAPDLVGAWVIAEGPNAGQRLEVGRGGIRTSYAPLRLGHGSLTRSEAGLSLMGDHAGLEVTVDLSLRADGRVTLTWSDGATFPATYILVRPG